MNISTDVTLVFIVSCQIFTLLFYTIHHNSREIWFVIFSINILIRIHCCFQQCEVFLLNLSKNGFKIKSKFALTQPLTDLKFSPDYKTMVCGGKFVS